MGMLRIISRRGDDRLHWNEQDALAGDAEAMAAVREAERIFARERAQGATAFRVEPGKAARRLSNGKKRPRWYGLAMLDNPVAGAQEEVRQQAGKAV